ncbi:hypothetical protein BC826DRAFT_323609 [Russula brevipes]|nr:hypothetical protein BC826DRAFT_323609 [Russula brevipes]
MSIFDFAHHRSTRSFRPRSPLFANLSTTPTRTGFPHLKVSARQATAAPHSPQSSMPVSSSYQWHTINPSALLEPTTAITGQGTVDHTPSSPRRQQARIPILLWQPRRLSPNLSSTRRLVVPTRRRDTAHIALPPLLPWYLGCHFRLPRPAC